MLSLAGLRARVVPTALNYLGVACGVAGLVTVIPPLDIPTFDEGDCPQCAAREPIQKPGSRPVTA